MILAPMTLPKFPRPTPDAPLPWLGWHFSLILPATLVLLALTLLFGGKPHVVQLSVQDESGNPLPGARVLAQEALYLTDDDGVVRLAVNGQSEPVTVEQDGYITMVGTVGTRSRTIPPVIMKEAHAQAGAPTAPTTGNETSNNPVAMRSTPAEAGSATPAPSGEPEIEVAGVVTNGSGEPVKQAWVTDGTIYAFTDNSGAFVFDPGAIASDATLTVFGAGYLQAKVPVPADGDRLDIRLEPQMIKGIYYNPNITRTEADVDVLIDLINTTELNAVVIDIKEEHVFYDTKVPFFHDAGIVTPVIDLPTTLKKFQDHGIYTIARLVVFKDSGVAETFPHLGVKDNVTGNLWRDMNGVAWVNPMLHELWDYNIELAVEAANLGFDEIQYDYVRFPTDGDLSRVEYGLPNTQEIRQRSIESFLERSREALIPTGVRLSADIFGFAVKVDDDLGIGQNVPRLAPHVDYLSPMVYPSHWPNGSVPVDGHPNDYPYETIKYSMELAIAQLDGDAAKLRPWLQDFNMPGMMKYGAAEVRAQIDASEELGLSGWLIWDPNNWYHDDAFNPATGSGHPDVAAPVATPQATTRASGTKSRRRRG